MLKRFIRCGVKCPYVCFMKGFALCLCIHVYIRIYIYICVCVGVCVYLICSYVLKSSFSFASTKSCQGNVVFISVPSLSIYFTITFPFLLLYFRVFRVSFFFCLAFSTFFFLFIALFFLTLFP
jgi:hypothetical protein